VNEDEIIDRIKKLLNTLCTENELRSDLQTLVDDYESECEAANERAYERYLEAYYGGEVETLDEQHQRAWQEKHHG
jgi:hypothetical protein